MMKPCSRYLMICLVFVLWNQRSLAQQNSIDKNTPLKIENADTATKKSGKSLQYSHDGQNSDRGATHQDTIYTVGSAISNSEEVPIGYGLSRSKNSLTSSVGMVRSSQLPVRSSIINSENLLFGKIPGLMVLSDGGKGNTPPGAHYLIRGRETFRSSAPLLLVDGFRSNSLRRVAPMAIKSVSVLKDAAALAMYGQRGANGVILIKTKHGGAHPLQVDANYTQTLTKPVGVPNMLGAAQYARALNEARRNDGLSPRYNAQDLKAFDSGNSPYLYPNVNWFDKVLRNYGTQSHMNITFSGGGNSVRYFALLDYGHYSGIFEPSQKDRGYKTQQKYGQLNFRGNLDIDLTDNLLLKFNFSSYLYDSNVPSEGTSTNDIFSALYATPSAAYPVKLPDGTWGGTQIHPRNPVAKVRDTGFGNLNARQLGINATLQQDLSSWLNGLSAVARVHFVDFGSYLAAKYRNYKYGFLSPVRDQAGNIIDTTVTKYGENTDLDYNESFNNQARHSAILGKVNYSKSFGNDELQAMLLVQQSSSDYDGVNNVYRYRKIAGDIHYSLDGTYFLRLTGSYAGRNLLPKNNRYSFFPAISAGWLLSNEDFLQTSSFLDRLKLRASWGIVGHDDIPNNKPYIKSYDYGGGGYYFENDNDYQAGVIENGLPSPDFRTSKSYKTNIGIDAGLFGHLDLAADVFYARRTDILVGSGGRYSNVIGIGTPIKSDGIVENRGMEVGLSWQDAMGDFAWHIGGQFTYARNKIVSMNEQYRPHDYLKRTGQPVGQRFGLQAIGFFDNEQEIANSPVQNFTSVRPGDIKYEDQNNDGIINKFDEVPIGYAGGYPEMYFSAMLGFHYKGFGFSALFQGTAHMTAYLNTKSVYWPLRNDNTVSSYYYKHRWIPNTTNSSAKLPRLTTQENDNNYRPNSIWLKDQSYIMLRNLKISYSLPVSVVKQLNMQDITFIARGRNLLSIDHIPVGRPAQYGSSYPALRYYSLGIDIAF